MCPFTGAAIAARTADQLRAFLEESELPTDAADGIASSIDDAHVCYLDPDASPRFRPS
jgi:hypothetical protein